MVFCMAFECSNASKRKGRKFKGENVSFHRLPLHDKDQLRKWIAALKLDRPCINSHSRVCSDHFEKEMFEDTSIKERLTGGKSVRRLKPNAVPTKFVFSKEASKASKQREERRKVLAEKRWPKKKKEITLEAVLGGNEGETSACATIPFPPEEIPLEACNCKTVVKISTSTQTDTVADMFKVQHDHSYARPILPTQRLRTSITRKVTEENIPSTSAQKETNVQHKQPDAEMSDEDTDNETDIDEDLYQPSESETESDDTNEEELEQVSNEAVFIVYKSSLDKLFKSCSECGSILDITQSVRGTFVVYNWVCHNNHRGRWESQPIVRGMPQGNLDLSAAMLFSGGTYRKVYDIANTMNLNIFSERHFMNIQKSYLFPVINELYQEQHQIWIDAFRYQSISLGGDGRSDTPGHCAKYLSYSLMEEDSELILHFELVQVTEAPRQAATNMERVGFTRAIDYLIDEDIVVECVTTDRHPQIQCDMNKLYPNITHEFDIFHVAKSIESKIRTASKKKGYEDLKYWQSSVKNHFWWSCASANGNYENLKDRWISILQHVCNVHEWNSSDTFHKCGHGSLTRDDIREITWLKPDSLPHTALQKIVLEKKLLKDMKKMTHFKHTGSLEVFHGMLLKYCPKREHFSYEGMRARLQLAVLDHNENVGREQATTDDGTPRFVLAFPKRKKQWVVKKVFEEKTFKFRKTLMEMVCNRRENKDVVLGEGYVSRPDIPVNIACTERPDKQDAIANFRTRFKLT